MNTIIKTTYQLLRNLCFLAIPLLLSSCANLETVRDFSKQSSVLTSGTEAIDYWGNWDERSKQYNNIIVNLPSKNNVTPKGPTGPITKPTKEELDAIKSLHVVISTYMDKLGNLAADNMTDVSKQVDGLVENLNNLPSSLANEKKKEVNNSYGGILKLLKLPLDAYRKHKVKKLIMNNDKNIQALIEGLSVAMDSVANFISLEEKNVLAWYTKMERNYPSKPSFKSAFQGMNDRASISSKYEIKVNALKSYTKALKTIADTHQKMAEDLSQFDTDSFKRLIMSLKIAKQKIIDARDQYRKAFN